MHAHLEAVRREADERERGLHELTRVIAARDARIAELEQTADERERETLLEHFTRRVGRLKAG
jgi:hypothetical protein